MDQGTTNRLVNDMPIHIEPLGQAAECEPMSADFHSGFPVIPKWRRSRFVKHKSETQIVNLLTSYLRGSDDELGQIVRRSLIGL